MSPHASNHQPRPRWRWAVAVTGSLAALTLAVTPAAAFAHGDDEPARAFDLVRQAIALIVNTPEDTDMIADKINDAAESADTTGVQVPLVEQAKEAFAAGELHQARALLEQSIGARVHTGDADPVVIGDVPPPATGEDTGTLAAIDALPGRRGMDGTDWTLLAIGVLVALVGIALSFRLRPHPVHSEKGR